MLNFPSAPSATPSLACSNRGQAFGMSQDNQCTFPSCVRQQFSDDQRSYRAVCKIPVLKTYWNWQAAVGAMRVVGGIARGKTTPSTSMSNSMVSQPGGGHRRHHSCSFIIGIITLFGPGLA